MGISNDDVRRELRDISREHEASLAPTAELIDRLYQQEADDQTKLDLIAGGAHRARYVKVGGIAVLTSAFLAACGGGRTTTTDTTAPPTPTTLADAGDVTAMRFAASLEHLTVAAYKAAEPLIKTPLYASLAKTFASQHADHAELFNAVIRSANGKDVKEANAPYLATFRPAIDGLKTEADALRLALNLETAVASTYVTQQANMKDLKLGATLVSVGGTEYRHAALLSQVLKTPIASTARGFLTDKEALAPRGV